jgi:hypothetical protein
MCNEPSRWNRPQAGGYNATERRHQQLRLTQPPLQLQQIHLGIFGHRFGETNADADQAHGFASSPECFL